MWDHIINIYPSKILRIKTKKSRINKYKKKLKWTIYIFYSNNILIGLFKELKKI